jgi:hypothetical protein
MPQSRTAAAAQQNSGIAAYYEVCCDGIECRRTKSAATASNAVVQLRSPRCCSEQQRHRMPSCSNEVPRHRMPSCEVPRQRSCRGYAVLRSPLQRHGMPCYEVRFSGMECRVTKSAAAAFYAVVQQRSPLLRSVSSALPRIPLRSNAAEPWTLQNLSSVGSVRSACAGFHPAAAAADAAKPRSAASFCAAEQRCSAEQRSGLLHHAAKFCCGSFAPCRCSGLCFLWFCFFWEFFILRENYMVAAAATQGKFLGHLMPMQLRYARYNIPSAESCTLHCSVVRFAECRIPCRRNEVPQSPTKLLLSQK